MLSSIFSTLGYALRLYSYLCIGYVFLSWVTSSDSPISSFLSEACSPYLNWFKRFRFAQIGALDFSPILAIGILSLLSNMCFQISIRGFFSPVSIIQSLISIFWSFFSFIINIFIIALVIRLILDMSSSYRSGNFVYMLDRFLSPVFVRVHNLLGGKFMSVRKQIVVCLIIVIIIRLILGAVFGSAYILFRGFRII